MDIKAIMRIRIASVVVTVINGESLWFVTITVVTVMCKEQSVTTTIEAAATKHIDVIVATIVIKKLPKGEC